MLHKNQETCSTTYVYIIVHINFDKYNVDPLKKSPPQESPPQAPSPCTIRSVVLFLLLFV